MPVTPYFCNLILESVLFHVIVEFAQNSKFQRATSNQKLKSEITLIMQHFAVLRFFSIIMISKSSFAIIWNFKDIPILTYVLT